MKRGLICSLFKGSPKYEDDRKNYRGISLLPIITKLMERLLLNRFKGWLSQCDIKFPSVNQNACQDGLCNVFLHHLDYKNISVITSKEIQKCMCVYLTHLAHLIQCGTMVYSTNSIIWVLRGDSGCYCIIGIKI